MAEITFVTRAIRADTTWHSQISDLMILTLSSGLQLYATTRYDGRMYSYEIDSGGILRGNVAHAGTLPPRHNRVDDAHRPRRRGADPDQRRAGAARPVRRRHLCQRPAAGYHPERSGRPAAHGGPRSGERHPCCLSPDLNRTYADSIAGMAAVQIGSNRFVFTALGTENGGDHNDILYGDDGHDELFGGMGDDLLYGGEGTDTLRGDEGRDTLEGQGGDDFLIGGPGADTFIFRAGHDRVLDFEFGADRIALDVNLWLRSTLSPRNVLYLYGRMDGTTAVLDFGEGNMLDILNAGGLDRLSSQIDFI